MCFVLHDLQIANVHSMCGTFLPALFNFAIEALKTTIDVLIIAYGIIFARLIVVTACDQQKLFNNKNFRVIVAILNLC